MAPNKRKTTATKVKKKKWFSIHAPAQFNEAILGETYITESAFLEGKYITANLSTITRSMRKQNVNIQFKIDKITEGKGYTTIVGYSLINAAIKRMVKRGRDKIADSFLAKTKDKKILRVKPLIVSLNQGTKSKQSAVRLETRRVIREFIFTKTVEEAFAAIIEGKLQKLIKESTAKIIPLKSVEIRIAKLEENTHVIVTEDGVKTEKVTIRSRDRGEKHALEEAHEQSENEAENDSEQKVPETVETETEATEDADEEIKIEPAAEVVDVKVDEEASIDDDEKDLDEEAEELIEKGEEEADATVEIVDEPETILEEVNAETHEQSEREALNDSEEKAEEKKEE